MGKLIRIDEYKAKKLLDKFYKAYPVVKQLRDAIVEEYNKENKE